jgi:nitrite reductase/ring-hydroxylating ferredoxin subunit
MAWYHVGNVKQFFGRTVTEVKAGRSTLCLVQVDGWFVATQPKCPHAGAYLSNGWCENGKLVCPLHRYSYDLTSGRGSIGQGDYINVYQVKVEHGKIYVKVNTYADILKQLLGIRDK